MQQICKLCRTPLSVTCDACRSLNVKLSRTQPDTLNCGNCLRRGVPLGAKIADGLCDNCTVRLRKQSARHGELKYEEN